MTSATLIFLRHGQTEHNILNIATGQMDIPLTSLGEEQASAAGPLIRDIHIDKVYSSPLQRAFNTAALVVQSAETQVHLLNADGTWQIEKRRALAEIDSGDFTGRNFLTDPAIKSYVHAYAKPLPNGESGKQVTARVKEFLDSEVKPCLARGENVLIVAHAGILKIFGIALGIDPVPEDVSYTLKDEIGNATPVLYHYQEGVFVNKTIIPNPKAKAAIQHKQGR